MKKFIKSLPFPNGHSITLIDIGARWGVNPPWDQVDKRYITYYGFEPDKDECEILNANSGKNVTYFPIALSDVEGKSILYLTKEPGCSSLLLPNTKNVSKFHQSDRFEILKKLEIQTVPLKQILFKNNIQPDVIKIDVQGLAFQVLNGIGNEFISDSLFFEIEVEYNEIYEGEHLFFEVSNLMHRNGFELLDICNYYAKQNNLPKSNSTRGQIMFADAFYIISIDNFYNKILGDEIKYRKIWKLIFILSVYGHFDLALEFALHPGSCLSNEEKTLVKKTIKRYTAISPIRVFLFNNLFFEKFGHFISLIGNYFQIKSRLSGWFSDNNSVSSRYKNQYRNPILNTFFRK